MTYVLTIENTAVLVNTDSHLDAFDTVKAMGLTPERAIAWESAEHWM